MKSFLFLLVLALVCLAASASAHTVVPPKAPLITANEFQIGPTLLYEARTNFMNEFRTSHDLEPAFGVAATWTVNKKYEISGTMARWFLANGGSPVQNYANLKLTYLMYKK